jgi:cyanophycinase
VRAVLALVCVGAVAMGAGAAPADAAVRRYRTGNPADVRPRLHGPVLDLGGGSADVDAAMQAMIDAVRGCTGRGCAAKLDVVVLRASGSDGYNGYIAGMQGVDSVETLVIGSARDANRPSVEATVRAAEIVFFAGGDPCDYVRYFRGTRVEAAVASVYARGGGVGGTSAGAAIQGEQTYDACRGSVLSSEALEDPYDARIEFTSGFFSWPHLEGTIADTHFDARDRMGRTLAFLARQVEDGARAALGIAIDEATSVLVGPDGRASVFGSGAAYFILADHLPEVCAPGRPLSYSAYKLWKVEGGGTFDLAQRPVTGARVVSVTGGRVAADAY